MSVKQLLEKYLSVNPYETGLEHGLSEESIVRVLNDQRRSAHILGVVSEAEKLAPYFTEVGEELIQTALLHDIGYADKARKTGFHPLDSGIFAANHSYGEQVLKGVLFHTGAKGEAELVDKEIGKFYEELSKELDQKDHLLIDLITYCDTQTSPYGIPTSIEGRVWEILKRYGRDHPVYKNITNQSDYFFSVRDKVLGLLKEKQNSLPRIFLDVDNTLILPGSPVGSKTKKSISSYVKAGGMISLVTGKIPASIESTIEELGLEHSPHIAGNGAIIVKGGQHRVIHRLGGTSTELIKIIESLEIPFCLYEKDRIYYSSKEVNDQHIDYLLSINEPQPIRRSELNGENAIKLLMFIDVENSELRETLEEELKLWKDRVTLIQTSPKLLEIMDIKQNKGNAIRKICQEQGLYYRYSIAVGDSENDLAMLNTVGKPYIVANASPLLQEMGFEVIPGCKDEGVSMLIDKVLEKGGILNETSW